MTSTAVGRRRRKRNKWREGERKERVSVIYRGVDSSREGKEREKVKSMKVIARRQMDA